jgi:succinate dehydrogenase/fumarate reductase flavoprotein subunit
MPHYTVGHLERVAAAEAALAPYPGLRIAGGAYRGVGLPDCIAQGRAAAEAILGESMAAPPIPDRAQTVLDAEGPRYRSPIAEPSTAVLAGTASSSSS